MALDVLEGAGSHGAAVVRRGEGSLARFVIDGGVARVVLDDLTCDGDEARFVVGAVLERARAGGAPELTVDVDDLLLRYEARRAGCTGALRTPLRWTRSAADAPAGGADVLAEFVERLVPSVDVSVSTATTRFGVIVRRALSGVRETVDLLIDVHDGGRRLRVAVPDVPDLMPEPIALAVDTAVAIRRRFRGAVPPVSAMLFDHSDHGFKSARVAGMANLAGAVVHLNASYTSVAWFVDMRRTLALRNGRTSSAQPFRPFTVVDGVVAHELWHQMESAFEVSRYRDSMELRRRLGEYFGVETLERAVMGRHPGSPPAWRDAYGRLTAEVSVYAGTTIKEATAEMFKLWWCSAGNTSGAVRLFGELVERYLLGDA